MCTSVAVLFANPLVVTEVINYSIVGKRKHWIVVAKSFYAKSPVYEFRATIQRE
jgi:hypothetical protein